MASVRKVAPSDRIESDPTAGMVREEAITTGLIWAGLVRTAPRMTSGWHQHGDHETTIFVLSGICRIESGPGGKVVTEGHAGDFLLVPPHTTHRESNPSDEESQLIVVRAGSGAPTINVDGPQKP